MSNVPVLLDIETRSACDLKTAGGYVYAADPSTRLLTVAWTDDLGETYHVWCPGATAAPPESDPDTTWHVGPECPMAHLTDRIWVAHNAWTFDREVWRAQPGLPQPRKWGDTYPLALQQGLPGQLDQIGKRLWGEGKMPEGKSALLKWTRAKDAADADPRNVPPGLTWLIARYNVQDVRLLSHLWKELDEGRKQPATENRVMFAHDAVNDRGVRVDLGLVRALRDLSRESVAHAVREIAELTGGALPDLHSLRQRNRVLDWLERHGVRLTSGGKRTVRREAVDQWLATIEGDAEETDGDPDAGAEFDTQSLLLAARVMRLRNAAMRITEAKLDAALSRVTDAGRLRGLFAYWSAHCVSGDTEVLTRNGWVRIDEWTGGDIVQWRPDGSMEWLHATPNRFETDEPTVELSGPHVTGRFTLGHTIPAYNTVGTFVTKQAGDMGNHPHYHLPLTGVRLVGDGTITAEQMRVLVAVQADGHWVTNTRHGRSLQWTFRKKRKIDRIQTLLAAVGVPYRIQEFPSCPGQVRVSVRWKDCPKWLSPERKVFGPWLFDSTEDARAAFLDELPRWDGHDPGPGGNLTYSSSISANLEWAQTMCHLAGVAAKVSGRCLTIRQTRTATCRAHEWTPAPPLGTVYCPTTVTGFWLYRHHGRIGVTGNTGRWAGRGMQVQNLPRPKKGVPVWDLIRQYEATGRLEYEAVRGMLSDGATTDDAASALIRGIFLPDEGQVLLAADLSSIESRVLAWLAGEESLVKTFTDFGCPYSLMASKLYGRAVTSKKDPIRQVGKVIVLGCLAEGTPVLTDRGWVSIEDVAVTDRVWDGEAWVTHGGVVNKGYKEVIECAGVWMTADHEVLTEGGLLPSGRYEVNGRFCLSPSAAGVRSWVPSADVRAGSSAAPTCTTSHPAARRGATGAPSDGAGRPRASTPTSAPTHTGVVFSTASAPSCLGVRLVSIRTTAVEVSESTRRGWRIEGCSCPTCGRFPERTTRDWRLTDATTTGGTNPATSGSPTVGGTTATHGGVGTSSTRGGGTMGPSSCACSCPSTDPSECCTVTLTPGETPLTSSVVSTRAVTYDIVNAGPNHRFQAGPLIVHNCGYGLGDQKFAQYGAAQGIDFAEQGVTPFECVDAFRTAFPRIAGHVQGEYEGRKWRRGGFWEDLQTVALQAVRSPGREMGVGRIGFEAYAGHLYVTLPSGRYLCYRNAREVEATTWWGKTVSTVEYQSPRFKGVTMYGGKWAENVVQAVSRDFLAGALVRLRSSTVLHVHDEVVASGRPKDLPAFMRAFTTRESWAAGLPLDAEGGIMPRYAKAPPPDWPKEETWRNGERVG